MKVILITLFLNYELFVCQIIRKELLNDTLLAKKVHKSLKQIDALLDGVQKEINKQRIILKSRIDYENAPIPDDGDFLNYDVTDLFWGEQTGLDGMTHEDKTSTFLATPETVAPVQTPEEINEEEITWPSLTTPEYTTSKYFPRYPYEPPQLYQTIPALTAPQEPVPTRNDSFDIIITPPNFVNMTHKVKNDADYDYHKEFHAPSDPEDTCSKMDSQNFILGRADYMLVPETELYEIFTTTPEHDPLTSTTIVTALPGSAGEVLYGGIGIKTTTDLTPSPRQVYFKMMEEQNEGYLTIFLLEILKITSLKDEKLVKEVLLEYIHIHFIFYSWYNTDQLMWFGQPLADVIQKLSRFISEAPIDYVRIRKTAVAVDVNSIIDYADLLYTDDEGGQLFDAIMEYEEYPNATKAKSKYLRKLHNRNTNKRMRKIKKQEVVDDVIKHFSSRLKNIESLKRSSNYAKDMITPVVNNNMFAENKIYFKSSKDKVKYNEYDESPINYKKILLDTSFENQEESKIDVDGHTNQKSHYIDFDETPTIEENSHVSTNEIDGMTENLQNAIENTQVNENYKKMKAFKSYAQILNEDNNHNIPSKNSDSDVSLPSDVYS
ncbi:hypothetical protein HF086_006479 [Spodoptera exigua]|uniref:Uncharacterized protein n=1 Tax=Spodoptera exigua TaxID=7107 RepID=A0A922SAG8_SPOEX|nr:hypothetical protein HF086_006479 [Spodoptera exigua]